MTVLFDATPDYVAFNDGNLDTRSRYLQKRAGATNIRLLSGPSWGASFTGSGAAAFYLAFEDWVYDTGTVSYSISSAQQTNVTVTGTGTSWTSVHVGLGMRTPSTIYMNFLIVKSVSSATSLVADSILSATGSHSGNGHRLSRYWAVPQNDMPAFATTSSQGVGVEK